MGAGGKFSAGIRLAIMAACYFLAVRYNADVQDAARIAVVSLADGGVTAETAETIWEEERRNGQDQDSGQDQSFGQGQANGQVQSFGQGQADGQAQSFGQRQANGQDQSFEQGQALSLCFWREQKDLRFSCRETGKAVQATGLLTTGNPELVIRGSGILMWQEKGCVMDTATAQELFGTQQTNGQLVWCGGEAYTVYGTFESLERMVVLRAGSGSRAGNTAGGSFSSLTGLSGATTGSSFGAMTGLSSGGDGNLAGNLALDHISFKTLQGSNAKACAEQFLLRYGLTGEISDFTFPAVVCGNLLLLLPALLALGLMRFLWSCLRADKRQSRDKAAEQGGTAVQDKRQSQDKAAEQGGTAVRDKRQSQDKAAGQGGTAVQDKRQSRDKAAEQGGTAVRDKRQSRDKAVGQGGTAAENARNMRTQQSNGSALRKKVSQNHDSVGIMEGQKLDSVGIMEDQKLDSVGITEGQDYDSVSIAEGQKLDWAGDTGSQNPAGKKRDALEQAACTALLFVMAALLFLTLREHLQIPSDMIPTRWSDFSFWPQWWTEQKKNLLRLLGSAQGERQLEALWSFGRSVLCDLLAIAVGASLAHSQKE